MSVRRLDVGTLELGGGLEVLVAAALEGVPAGGEIDVVLASRAAALELPAWTRIAGHEVTGEQTLDEGGSRRFLVRVRRGVLSRVLGAELPPRGRALADDEGHVRMDSVREMVGEPPPHAAADSGLVPLGALAEPGAPGYAWQLSERDALWADEIATLTETAAADQWNATADIPWDAAAGLPDDVERAVSQVMTYIAQNEYAALYVPARYLPQVNPQYTEVLMWLASHVQDEARHVEVFTKRSLAGGARAYGLASTELSLHTLMEENDFSGSALLLNVLGEGTFLDLLRFVEENAPDAATGAAARLAHRDERRHVHFGDLARAQPDRGRSRARASSWSARPRRARRSSRASPA